jgi:hypothetical protein
MSLKPELIVGQEYLWTVQHTQGDEGRVFDRIRKIEPKSLKVESDDSWSSSGGATGVTVDKESITPF